LQIILREPDNDQGQPGPRVELEKQATCGPRCASGLNSHDPILGLTVQVNGEQPCCRQNE